MSAPWWTQRRLTLRRHATAAPADWTRGLGTVEELPGGAGLADDDPLTAFLTAAPMDADFGLPGDNLLGLLDDTFQPHPFPPEALSPSQATGRSYTAPMPMNFDGSNPVASTGTQVRPLPFPFPSPRRRRGSD